jgi:hypothetical protein
VLGAGGYHKDRGVDIKIEASAGKLIKGTFIPGKAISLNA